MGTSKACPFTCRETEVQGNSGLGHRTDTLSLGLPTPPGLQSSPSDRGGKMQGTILGRSLLPPPLKKITYAKKFLRNYFRGDCDGFA